MIKLSNDCVDIMKDWEMDYDVKEAVISILYEPGLDYYSNGDPGYPSSEEWDIEDDGGVILTYQGKKVFKIYINDMDFYTHDNISCDEDDYDPDMPYTRRRSSRKPTTNLAYYCYEEMDEKMWECVDLLNMKWYVSEKLNDDNTIDEKQCSVIGELNCLANEGKDWEDFFVNFFEEELGGNKKECSECGGKEGKHEKTCSHFKDPIKQTYYDYEFYEDNLLPDIRIFLNQEN